MYRLIEADHYIKKNILVVGGGDSAIEAAMGLGHQIGNKVTLSYRKEAFSRIVFPHQGAERAADSGLHSYGQGKRRPRELRGSG
jgi:thioredoxin reductase